jgi:D-lactate dehydrogenase (quinone)
MTHDAFLNQLKTITGEAHVLTRDADTRGYRTGYRFGTGNVLCVVRPANLIEQWRVVQACVAANKIVIMQAANTGLTGGSTPDGNDYDRDIVLINTLRMNKVQLIKDGKQVVCFPGATLDQLETVLAPLGREPHSVIGSSCIGASVLGGVCNNSGGSLVQRGPAYTELTLFAQVDGNGALQLVNHLGITLGSDPEEILFRLENGTYDEADIQYDTGAASDHHYAAHVRDVDANTPARYNADPSRLHEGSGCAGKLILFAVRLDTFEKEKNTIVFYIGTNNPDELTEIRRYMLAHFKTLPVAGEYMHREAYDIAKLYGKDVFLAIQYMGTKRIPLFFRLKSKFDALIEKIPVVVNHLSDHLLQWASKLFPDHLPQRMNQYRDRYEHHLMIKMAGDGIEEARQFLKTFFGTASGAYFECDAVEGGKAFLHRFAVAGAAVRYRAVHDTTTEGIVALDIALKRNDRHWVEILPPAMDAQIIHKLYYGHFMCHVFHQDYLIRKGQDCLAIEHHMWDLLDQRGAEYPAEHNVGHLYPAKPALKEFYHSIDPCNCFNPGIGQTSKKVNWN